MTIKHLPLYASSFSAIAFALAAPKDPRVVPPKASVHAGQTRITSTAAS
jgi:hypothetical protein